MNFKIPRISLRSVIGVLFETLFTVTILLILWAVVGFGYIIMSAQQLWRNTNGVFDKTLSAITILAILGAIGLLGYIIANPPAGERYTEFYILGIEGKAEGYPDQLSVGEEGKVILSIVNQEHHRMSYEVELLINGEKTVGIGPIELAHEEKWEEVVGFIPQEAGEEQKVQYRLYKIRELGEEKEGLTLLSLWLGQESLDATVVNQGLSEASYQMGVEIKGNEMQETPIKSIGIGPEVLLSAGIWDAELGYANTGNMTQKAEFSLYRDGILIYQEEVAGGYPVLHIWINVE